MTMELNKIYEGDAYKLIDNVDDEFIDFIPTDPDYGYNFMNKDWGGLPPTSFWEECLRVLKSGSFMMVCSAPRLDVQWRMASRIEEAGFLIGFTPIYWAYASGFPKAMNISKAVDKRNQNLHLTKDFGNYLKEKRLEKGLSKNDIDKKLNTNTAYSWWEGRNYLGRFEIHPPTKELYDKLKLVLELNDRFDILIERIEAEREVIGKSKYADIDRSGVHWVGGKNNHKFITASATYEAKTLDGSYAGFQPKPAVEVVMVAMKPLSEKSYVDQALVNGKGVTWLDDARIPYESEDDMGGAVFGSGTDITSNNYRFGKGRDGRKDIQPNNSGRFPANLLVSDDVLNDGTITKGGGIGGRHNIDGRRIGAGSEEFGFKSLDNIQNVPTDSGSFSRYFSLDAWWSERIKHLPKEVQKTFPFLIVPKPSKLEKNKGLKDFNKQKVNDGRKTEIDNAFQRGETERHNIHPTVKSVALFSYLITLGSRRGDVILDPFMGSGTAGIAAYSLGRNFLGFEKDPDYFNIGNHRIVDELKNKKLEAYIDG